VLVVVVAVRVAVVVTAVVVVAVAVGVVVVVGVVVMFGVAVDVVLVLTAQPQCLQEVAFVIKMDVIRALSIKWDVSQKQVRSTINDILEEMSNAIVEGGNLELRNFGVFDVRVRAARISTNPRTGEPVKVKRHKTVTFRPGRKLRARLSPGRENKRS